MKCETLKFISFSTCRLAASNTDFIAVVKNDEKKGENLQPSLRVIFHLSLMIYDAAPYLFSLFFILKGRRRVHPLSNASDFM